MDKEKALENQGSKFREDITIGRGEPLWITRLKKMC